MHPARLERYDINEAHDDECMFDSIHPCRYQNDCTFQFIIECRRAIASGALSTLRQNKKPTSLLFMFFTRQWLSFWYLPAI